MRGEREHTRGGGAEQIIWGDGSGVYGRRAASQQGGGRGGGSGVYGRRAASQQGGEGGCLSPATNQPEPSLPYHLAIQGAQGDRAALGLCGAAGREQSVWGRSILAVY